MKVTMTVPICRRHTTLATKGLSTLGRSSSEYLTHCCLWTLNSYILQLMVCHLGIYTM